MFGRPSGPQDRTQPAKLEIPFGHAFDKRGVSLPKSAVRVHPVGLRSAIEAGVFGPSGVGKLRGTSRSPFSRRSASRMLCANRDRTASSVKADSRNHGVILFDAAQKSAILSVGVSPSLLSFRYPNLASRNRCMVCELLALADAPSTALVTVAIVAEPTLWPGPGEGSLALIDKHDHPHLSYAAEAHRSCGTQSARRTITVGPVDSRSMIHTVDAGCIAVLIVTSF